MVAPVDTPPSGAPPPQAPAPKPRPNVAGMVSDPAFNGLPAAQQRQALAGLTGDNTFLSLSDGDTAQFVLRMKGQKAAATAAQPAPAAAVAPVRPGGIWGNLPQPPPPGTPLPLAGQVLQAAGNLGVGALESAGQTIRSVGTPAPSQPITINVNGKPLTIPAPTQSLAARAIGNADLTPHGIAQNVGAFGEQAGELAAGAPEKIGLEGAGALAKILARGGVAAADAKAHNQNALVAGMTGGGSEAALALLDKIAPSMMEAGINTRQVDRDYGKTPGETALADTKGLTPAAIKSSSRAQINGLTAQVNGMAAAHPGTIDLSPARNVVDSLLADATIRNNAAKVAAVRKVQQQLSEWTVGGQSQLGQPIPTQVSASMALNLKRGLADLANFSGDSTLDRGVVSNTAKQAARAIDSQLDKALGPGFADANQRLSSLIDVNKSSARAARGATLPQRVQQRLAAHTGAMIAPMVGAAAGGAEGYRDRGVGGGVGGALAGGAATLLGMEGLASKPVPITIARILDTLANSRVAAPVATAAASSLTRKPDLSAVQSALKGKQ